MENKKELPYIDLKEFNEKVEEYGKTNFIFKSMKARNSNWTWEDLPKHLQNQLFDIIGSKPIVQKY